MYHLGTNHKGLRGEVEHSLEDLIFAADEDERRVLAALLGCSQHDCQTLETKLQSQSRTLWQKLSNKRVLYSDLLASIGRAHGIRKVVLETDRDYERRIVRKIARDALSHLSPETRHTYLSETHKKNKAATSVLPEAFGATGIVAAQASGFGVYQMATTVMGAASAAAHITIPFIGYMALTKGIFFVIGPLGWTALGASVLHKITKPDYERMVAVVAWALLVRTRVFPQITIRTYSLTEVFRKVLKASPLLLALWFLIPNAANTSAATTENKQSALPAGTLVQSLDPEPQSASPRVASRKFRTEIMPTQDIDAATQGPSAGDRDITDAHSTLYSQADQETTVRIAINHWAHAMESNDPVEESQCYAPQVDRFFLKRNVPKSYVAEYMQNWLVNGDRKIVRFQPTSLAFRPLDEDSVEVELIEHVVTLVSGISTERDTRSELILKRVDAQWLIWSERDFVSLVKPPE